MCLATFKNWSTAKVSPVCAFFAGIEESKGEVRKMLASLLPLDYAASAENCKQMALLLSTWDAARLQPSIHEKNKADSKLGVQARLVQSTEQASMTAAVEPWHGRLSDSELPSKSLLATKLEQVEENAPYPEDLRDVTSVEDAAIEAYDAIKDRSACPYAHMCKRYGKQHPYHKCPKVRRSDE